MFEQEDGELNLILPLVLGVAVILSIATALFAGLALPQFAKPAKAPAAAVSPAAVAPAAAPVAAAPAAVPASLLKVYFETGKAELADADRQAIAGDLVATLKARPDMRVAITGYTDASGNLDQNLELAKQRAFAVRDALVAAGVAEARLALRKPEAITGTGDPKEARRVELYPAE